MQSYLVVIEGISALLQHRFSDAEATEENTRRVHVKKQDPRQAAEKAAYRNEAGELYIPGTAVARMLREAGASHKQRGSRKSLKYVVPAAVLVVEEQIVLRDAEGKSLKKFEIDSRPVVIPSTKGRIMRHRPRLNAWHAEFTLEIKEDLMDPSLIHQLLAEGGLQLGLLDFRPEKGGSFGRFQITSWAFLAQTEAVLAAAAD
jgi:hypothetical protein